jgi:hypothetical protein
MVNADGRLRSANSGALSNGTLSDKQPLQGRDAEEGYGGSSVTASSEVEHRENESSSSCSRGSIAFDRNGEEYDEYEEECDDNVNDRVPLVVRSSAHTVFGEEMKDYDQRPRYRTNKPRRKSFLTNAVVSIVVIVMGLCILYAWSSPSGFTIEVGSSVPKQNRTNTTSRSPSLPRPESSAPSTDVAVGPNQSQQEQQQENQQQQERLPVHFICPKAPPAPFVSKMDKLHHSEWYEKGSSQVANGDGRGVRNVSEYLKVFREAEFDNWGHSYDQVKRGMKRWKSEQFIDLLLEHADEDSADGVVKTVYESACGIGLNLLMTLEILKESTKRSVSHVVVYGNEYQRESTLVAQAIASSRQFPGRPGTICQSDSTNLSYVPSDSFDLVYTGYISPLADPLRLADKYAIDSDEELYGFYTEYCESKNESVHARAQRAQHYQEEWYARWASEMIRIAKPGAKVIVEQVSYPLCEALYDWGGVSQHFWTRAAAKYGWQVDADAFEYQDDTIFRHRYHLMMRKLPAKQPAS